MTTPSGVIPSPNIWGHPEVYELENRGCDRERVIELALATLRPLAGADVVDVGCGSGYHLPILHAYGARVVGVEPHPPLLALARRRLASLGLDTITVHHAGAAALPLPTASVDLVHARWAYFFGPGCEPGLAEVARVLRPGGLAAFVDIDATRSTFGRWFRQSHPGYDPAAVERFWAGQGFARRPLTIRWSHERREDLEAVVRLELPPQAADRALAEHPGTSVDYAINLWHRTY